MSNFKNFTEKISCRVIPITRDRRVWLDEKVVDDDSYCAFINGRSYELGEEYDKGSYQKTYDKVVLVTYELHNSLYQSLTCSRGA